MTRSTQNPSRTAQPSIALLTAKLLSNYNQHSPAESEVEPYEVVSGFRADATTTWRDACSALDDASGVEKMPAQPSFWVNFIRTVPAQTSLPLALGTFPQLAADLTNMLKLKPSKVEAGTVPSGVQGFLSKAERSTNPLDWLMAAAIARLSGDYDLARELLARVPAGHADFGTLRTSELAATHWMSGDYDQAIREWESLPASAAVAFNLGMAYLFTGRKEAALEHLELAVARLAESAGWKQLAQLYLSLARIS